MSEPSRASAPGATQVEGRRALMVLLLFVPGLAALAFIVRFSVNCIFWDEWDVVPFLEDFYAHRLTLARLFEQHNEHRIFSTRLIFVYLGTLTSYDTRIFMYLSWAALAVALLCLARMHVRCYGSSTRALVLFLPVAVLQFHLRQYENLLWGWQLTLVLCVVLFVVAVSLLADERAGRGALLGAIACLFVGTFTFSSGLISWLAILCLLAYQRVVLTEDLDAPGRRALHERLLATSAAAALAFALYLHGWVKPADHPSAGFVLQHPLVGLEELCGALGSAASYQIEICIGAGAVLLLLLLVTAVFAARGWLDARRFAPAVPLLAFSLGVAAMIALGRAGFGVLGANASRYVTLTVPALIGLYYAALAAKPTPRGKVLLAAVGLTLAAVVAMGDWHILYIGEHEEAKRELGVDVILHPNQHTESEARVLHPRPEVILSGARVLAAHRLNVFAE